MNQKRIKRVLMKSRKSDKAHYGIECAQKGKFTYLLCRGFPSIAEHIHIPEQMVQRECKQCERVFSRMKRQKPDGFILIPKEYDEYE